MTIINTRKIFRESSFIAKKYASLDDGFIKIIINKIFFNTKWLRIFSETTIKDLINIYKSAKYNNLPVIVFMIHSSELMPGGSPYVKTKEALEKSYNKLDKFFNYLNSKKVQSFTLGEFADNYAK